MICFSKTSKSNLGVKFSIGVRFGGLPENRYRYFEVLGQKLNCPKSREEKEQLNG